MNIQVASLFTSSPYSVASVSKRQSLATSATVQTTIADKLSLSSKATTLSTKPSSSATETTANANFDTDAGSKNLNIDAYFSPNSNVDFSSYSRLPPLLLPSPNNINALSKHISAAMPQFLSENNIPSPPSSISYDNEGKIQLPADYPSAAQFKQALDKNPAMERELRTVNALTSHYVEMSKSIPFIEDYQAANNSAEQAAVVKNYSYLFSANRQYTSIALQFSSQGSLSFTADGEPYRV
jgi:hypothetical protein